MLKEELESNEEAFNKYFNEIEAKLNDITDVLAHVNEN